MQLLMEWEAGLEKQEVDKLGEALFKARYKIQGA